MLIDDYAHHPTEIKAVHQAISEMYPDAKKAWLFFQPHLFFQKHKTFADDFCINPCQRFDEVLFVGYFTLQENCP